MDLELQGRRALVTASSAGIGAVVARRLVDEGCAVLLHGRDPQRAEEVAVALRRAGGTVDVALGDLTNQDSAAMVADQARAWGTEVLVNNAGPFNEDDWDTAEVAAWQRSAENNVISAVQLIRALTPRMRQRGWGRVINLGSRAATTPLPNMVTYSAAKAAVVSMTTSLAKHLAGSGVTANTVSPGVIVTDSMQQMFQTQARKQRRSPNWADLEQEIVDGYAANPSGRLGTAQDIAATIAFLASPLAGYVNGIDLRVDGGITGVP